jgi:hypothetical protein
MSEFEPVNGVWGEVDGVPITEELIDAAVANAEAGFPGVVARPVGRPLMGERPARSVAVRLDPELDAALLARAAATDESASEVIREALRAYLHVA